MNITERQKILFEELGQQELIDDGVVDEEQYTKAAYRIMYVLKEVNGGKDWSLCDFLRDGGRAATWDNIARWTEGIFNLPEELPWSRLEEKCSERRKIMLPQICAVNVKKTSGSDVADMKTIYESAQKNADILRQQLNLYAPDIVICCGTDRAFTDACYSEKNIEWQMTKRGVWYFKDGSTTIIAFSHPAARVKDQYLYYALMDAVREIGLHPVNWIR